MNHGSEFDTENAADRKRRITEQKKKVEERETRKRLEAAAPELLEALENLYNDCRNVPMVDEQRNKVMEAAYQILTEVKNQ